MRNGVANNENSTQKQEERRPIKEQQKIDKFVKNIKRRGLKWFVRLVSHVILVTVPQLTFDYNN